MYPAWGQTCITCGKSNHFSTVCYTKRSIASSQSWEPVILIHSLDWLFQQIVMDLFYVGDHAYLACTDRLTGWLILYHLEPGHATTSKLMSAMLLWPFCSTKTPQVLAYHRRNSYSTTNSVIPFLHSQSSTSYIPNG